jgi:predicted GIY-YIG superfamily endonuclease
MHFVYVIQSSKNGACYTGETENLERRLIEHNSGKRRFTSGRGPWTIVHIERYESSFEARRRERFLKSGNGRAVLKNILDGKGFVR